MKFGNLSRVPIARRASITQPKKVFHVFCEGEKTEPNYLNSYLKHLGDVPYNLQIVAPIGVAKTVVTAAREEREKLIGATPGENIMLDETDEFWVVFDCDGEDEAYSAALQQAATSGLKVGCSNPCFELWLIMHFEHCDVPDGHKELQRRIRLLCPEYNPTKNKTVNFAKLKDKVESAEQRAVRLRTARTGDGANRPQTTFDLLTKALREASKPIRHGRARELEGIKPFEMVSSRHRKAPNRAK